MRGDRAHASGNGLRRFLQGLAGRRAAVGVAKPASPRVLRLLVVDDVAPNREILRAMLTARGHVADLAEGGEAAIARAESAGYDAILMDLRMPGMDGLEATRRIRALGGRNAALPVLAVSADLRREQIAACRHAGMNGHIGKPFAPEALLAAIADAIAASNAGNAGPAGQPDGTPGSSAEPDGPAAAEVVFDAETFARTAGFLSAEAAASHMQGLAGTQRAASAGPDVIPRERPGRSRRARAQAGRQRRHVRLPAPLDRRTRVRTGDRRLGTERARSWQTNCALPSARHSPRCTGAASPEAMAAGRNRAAASLNASDRRSGEIRTGRSRTVASASTVIPMASTPRHRESQTREESRWVRCPAIASGR